MYKNRFILSSSLLIFSILAFSQNSTNSPYTRFGLGDVSDNANGARRALGGASVGFRSAKEINTVNPASYSAVDTLSFMFDVGLSGMYSYFSAPNGSVSKPNGNLEYVTMQFPVAKFLGVSAGLLPYSFSGYSFSTSSLQQIDPNNAADTVRAVETYGGSGTISQVYLGLSAKFFKHLSIGANAYYMFGNVSNQRTVSYSNTTSSFSDEENRISVSNLRFRYGLQAFHTFNKKHDFTLGAFFENRQKMNAEFIRIRISQVADSVTRSDLFDLPQAFGVGLYYSYNKKLTVGADFSVQQWQNAKFFGRTDSLVNRFKAALGAEYIHNPNGYKYTDHLRYRAGVSVSNSYYDINGQKMPLNIGVSVGMGFPMPKSNSIINASLEYGKIGNRSQMTENYFKLIVSATINEFWFFKRKL